MLRYAASRLLGIVPTLFLVITFAFFVVRLAPGGPFDQQMTLSPEIRANLEAAYGLDAPMWTQYGRYLKGLLHGDFGPSFRYRDFTVTELIRRGLPVSLTIGFLALVLAVTGGIAAGCVAALHRDRWIDPFVMGVAVIGMILPLLVVAPLLQLIFGIVLGWLPVSGWRAGALDDVVLPAVTLALPLLAYIARLMRGSMLEVLASNFIRTARAKGLPWRRVILRHALPPALLPVVSYLGPASAMVLTGSLVVESLFGLPGSGRYLIEGALNRDYTLVLGMTVVVATLTLGLNLLADLIYAWLDPRVRHAVHKQGR
jgi:oligopeptide transport system permease protein